MFRAHVLAAILAVTTGLGCTASSGRTYKSEEWSEGRPLGKVLVISPRFAAASSEGQTTKDQQIRSAIRDALAGVPGTTVIDAQAAAEAPGTPVSESDAIGEGRRSGADTVCVVTLGQFGGRYLLTLLPPGWDSRTSVQYSMRLIDVKSGRLLIDSVRERTAGGYLAVMTATYPEDLRADLASVLTTPK